MSGDRCSPRARFPSFARVAEIPAGFGPTVAAIGNFDGVHLGHREILVGRGSAKRERAAARAVAITFDPHPEQFLRPAQAPAAAHAHRRAAAPAGCTGIDAVLVLPFDAALAALAAREFVQAAFWLRRSAFAACMRAATFALAISAEAGVSRAESVRRGVRLCRACPPSGAGARAGGFQLGDPRARGRGRRAPRALDAGPALRGALHAGARARHRHAAAGAHGESGGYDGLLPAFGVYVTRLTVGGRRFQAVTNVGNRPTFGEASFAVESHILDFEPIELDEQTPIELEFLLRLRGERDGPRRRRSRRRSSRMWRGRSGISGLPGASLREPGKSGAGRIRHERSPRFGRKRLPHQSIRMTDPLRRLLAGSPGLTDLKSLALQVSILKPGISKPVPAGLRRKREGQLTLPTAKLDSDDSPVRPRNFRGAGACPGI